MQKQQNKKVQNAYFNSHVFTVGDTVKVFDGLKHDENYRTMECEIVKLMQNYCSKGKTWARVIMDNGFETNYPLEQLRK